MQTYKHATITVWTDNSTRKLINMPYRMSVALFFKQMYPSIKVTSTANIYSRAGFLMKKDFKKGKAISLV